MIKPYDSITKLFLIVTKFLIKKIITRGDFILSNILVTM